MIGQAVGLGAVFIALCAAVLWPARRFGPLGLFVATLVLGTVFFTVALPGYVLPGGTVVPGIAMAAANSVRPLPLPALAYWVYLLLIVIGGLVAVSSDDEWWRDFRRPIVRGLCGDVPRAAAPLRVLVLYACIPLAVGWGTVRGAGATAGVPIESRQAHPSISYDPDLVSPVRHPRADRLAAFAAAEGLADAPVGDVPAAYREAILREGRHLYGKNCSHCHGGKADGTGHLARALRLRPADFTDSGTIATLVEAYAFRRVMDGGIGLPGAGTPWDSAMPRWKGELTEEEVFKILLAEYDIAGVSPRVPEKLE